MKRFQQIKFLSKRLTLRKLGILFFLFNGFMVNAQSVITRQNLNFGSFIVFGQGGTILVTPNNNPATSTGGIMLKGGSAQAIFEISDLKPKNKKVLITYPGKVTLTGNHGGALNLVLNNDSPSGDGTYLKLPSPFYINIGGTLTIGYPSLVPAGNYSGTFQVAVTIVY